MSRTIPIVRGIIAGRHMVGNADIGHLWCMNVTIDTSQRDRNKYILCCGFNIDW